jgi:16S rRNA U1498 N3-methylase RsmE
MQIIIEYLMQKILWIVESKSNINPIIDIPNQYKMFKKVINKHLEIMEENKKEDNKNKLWIMNKSISNKIKIIVKFNN